MRRATDAVPKAVQVCTISIHALLAESDYPMRIKLRPVISISIHALLAESDDRCGLWEPLFYISIHALLAESDGPKYNSAFSSNQFLSTLSLRRATVAATRQIIPTIDFYPRSPCGERHSYFNHAILLFPNFYPRSPCGERQQSACFYIHFNYFYPRSPCGERPTL